MVGPSKQASQQANIHTHGCNEVTLVWGSLRLALIMIVNCSIQIHKNKEVRMKTVITQCDQTLPQQNWWFEQEKIIISIASLQQLLNGEMVTLCLLIFTGLLHTWSVTETGFKQ